MPRLVLAVLVSTTLGACAHGLIEGTQIRDTPATREVLDVVHKAMDALAHRDAKTLLALVSPRYFSDNGTPDPRDDYGYQQLETKILPETFAQTKEMFIDVDVQDVVVEGDSAHADVRYSERARVEGPNGTQWETKRDFDRIQLARESGTWKITGGL